jgi:hypothetical protein
MTVGLAITPKGGAQLIELGSTDAQHLANLKTVVGGWVECVTLAPNLTLWVNEDGLREHLPVNQLASMLIDNGQPVVGSVVIAGGANPDGSLQSLPQEWLDMIERHNQGADPRA